MGNPAGDQIPVVVGSRPSSFIRLQLVSSTKHQADCTSPLHSRSIEQLFCAAPHHTLTDCKRPQPKIMAPQIPKLMSGVLIEKTGGTEVLQYKTDLPVPSLKEGEVLIKNEIIGINFIDTYFRTGLYPSPKPQILGREAAGYVVGLGPKVEGFAVKDRIVWMATDGGYAEYTAVPASKTIHIPEEISFSDACAALLQGLTALTITEEGQPVVKGDWALVLAASGGVGGWLCQILKAKGVHTIATVGSQSKVQIAKDAGAEIVLVEGEDDVKAEIIKRTNSEGVRAVFDGVGKVTFDRSLDVVARKGSVISFGNASGAVEPFTIGWALTQKR